MGKILVDYIKVNKTRRNRGYSFEYATVQYLKKIGWHAKRLGGSSVNLPDILATHDDTIYSMEAKSVMLPKNPHAYIPYDQIHRCIDMLGMFPVYKKRYLVFAFKFSDKKSRPKYHFFGFDLNHSDIIKQFGMLAEYNVRCSADGKLLLSAMDLDYDMYTTELPFQTPLTLNSDLVK